ncbi:hypothetical protein REPUB_Repub12eG0042700 [Reevesia pubescens]
MFSLASLLLILFSTSLSRAALPETKTITTTYDETIAEYIEGEEEVFLGRSEISQRILAGYPSKYISYRGLEKPPACNANIYGNCIKPIAGKSADYTPIDYILLSCGASSTTISEDGRKWITDERSKFSTSNFENTSFISTASSQDHSVTQVPYMTARIFNDKFTYSFPVSPGLKFLRLYFDPLKTQSTSLIKEFMVPVSETEKLNVTFLPSPNSLAFVNGIEVVSMPKNMYRNHQESSSSVNSKTPFDIPDATAFETVYRLNVGGATVANIDDTGMFRSWREDFPYIFGAAAGITPSRFNVTVKYTEDTPAYTAPVIVYTTSRTMGNDPNINMKYNLTWNFLIDTGFNYLLRLHFCETQLEVTLPGQRVLDIFINNQTAELHADVINWSHGNSIPVYRDYVLSIPSEDQSEDDRGWEAR